MYIYICTYICATPLPVGNLFVVYILATSNVISGWILNCDTITCYPTKSHYPVTGPTSPFPILIMLSPRLGSNKNQL